MVKGEGKVWSGVAKVTTATLFNPHIKCKSLPSWNECFCLFVCLKLQALIFFNKRMLENYVVSKGSRRRAGYHNVRQNEVSYATLIFMVE